ncbi:hypothetical protein ACOMHN_066076 [Nucella lapillus]
MVGVSTVTSLVAVVVVGGAWGWGRGGRWGWGAAPQRSIVFVHGILGDVQEFDTMQAWINKDFANTSTHSLTCYPDLSSLAPLWTQLTCFSRQLTAIMTDSPGGVTLICYSQGGVICRGLLSTLRHNVDTVIALSSPLAGQFGDTSYLKPFFHDIVKEKAYLLFYTKAGQDTSVGNYWNDPHHTDLYVEQSVYLAVLNNDTANNRSAEFKSNFLRVKNLVLIGGPQDEIIGPWQSSHFGFYDSNEVVQPMTNQSGHVKDGVMFQGHVKDGVMFQGHVKDGVMFQGHVKDGVMFQWHVKDGVMFQWHVKDGVMFQGHVKDGVMFQGHVKDGVMFQGHVKDGVMFQWHVKDGVMFQGHVKDGVMFQGHVKDGVMFQGHVKDGVMFQGHVKDGVMFQGHVKDGVMFQGHVKDGVMFQWHVKDGVMFQGHVKDGVMFQGHVKDGVMFQGHVKEGIKLIV